MCVFVCHSVFPDQRFILYSWPREHVKILGVQMSNFCECSYRAAATCRSHMKKVPAKVVINVCHLICSSQIWECRALASAFGPQGPKCGAPNMEAFNHHFREKNWPEKFLKTNFLSFQFYRNGILEPCRLLMILKAKLFKPYLMAPFPFLHLNYGPR